MATGPLEQEERPRERIARGHTLVVLPKVYSGGATGAPSKRPWVRALFRDVAAGLVDQIAAYYPYDVIPAGPDAADLLRCLEKRPRVKILSTLNTIRVDMLDEGVTLHVNGTYVLEHPGYRLT